MEVSCRKCRRVLLTDEDLIEKHRTAKTCTSYYTTEAPSWLKTDDPNVIEGKLFCPHCETRVGTWSWAGTKCSCGEWVTPAFQFHCGRLDSRATNYKNKHEVSAASLPTTGNESAADDV